MIRVALVDDHALVREGVRGALELAGFCVCAETGDGAAVFDVVGQTDPDVLLIDIALGPFDGIEIAHRLTDRSMRPRVVVLSMFDDMKSIEAAADAGACAYLVKDCSLQTLVETVRGVAGGLDELSAVRRTDRSGRVRSPLSRRETEVLQLVASGASTKEVAQRLFVSAKTVKNHLSAVYEKLGVSSRTQAVAAGLRLGVVALAGSTRE